MERKEKLAAFVALLRVCAKKKDLYRGISVHADILKRGWHDRSSDALLNMYAKCGALMKAKELFAGLPFRDVFSWTALISGYAQHGRCQDALNCFECMQREHISPDAVTFSCILKACGSIGAADKGEQIHDEIVRQGLLGKDIVLGNALVDMYAKCGVLAKAHRVLQELPARDVVSWNSLIAGYGQQGNGVDALNCFEQMQREGLSPNAVTFTCVLKACGSIRAIDKGEQIHEKIARERLLGNDIVLSNALVDMYAKCGAFVKARRVLEELPARDVSSWTALIAGYAEQGKGEDALNCFEQMQCEGISPNAVSFACVLKACGSIGATDKGVQIHDTITRQGLLVKNIVLGNALVDMYARCGALAKAARVLEEIPSRDIVSWNALITGYNQHGKGQDALNCFDRMQCDGLFPNTVTFVCILKACGSVGAVDKGEHIHSEMARQGLLGNDVVLGTALVDMYAKCGALSKAQQVVEELCASEVASWNALIAGYAQQGRGEDALNHYEQMQFQGLSPDAATFACVLKACGSIGAVDKGEQIHDEIMGQGLLGNNVVLGNALVDMYAKCGALGRARRVFEELPARDVVSWNALIAGYAQQGQGEEAVNCFEWMRCEGLSPNAVSWNALIAGYALHGKAYNASNCLEKMQCAGLSPDAITFSCMLNACSHSGLVDDGQMYFTKMSTEYGIRPQLEHYICLIDLFGRAGHVDKAVKVIQEMPSSDNCVVWHALLGACQKWQDVNVGRWAFEHAIRVEKSDAAAYILMANIYAAAGMQEDVERVLVMRVENKACRKEFY